MSWYVKMRERELTFMPAEAIFEFGKRVRGWGGGIWNTNWPGIAYSNRTEGYEMKRALETIVGACPRAIQNCSLLGRLEI